MKRYTFFSTIWLIVYAFILGTITAYSSITMLLSLAEGVSNIFINLLMLISLPLIFLSITSTISGMESFEDMKQLGKKTIKYTFSTTIIAATIALVLFKIINPVREIISTAPNQVKNVGGISRYFSFLAKIIPSNVIETFGDNSNVASVVFLAIMISFAVLSLPTENKKFIHLFFYNFFSAILKITNFIIFLIPIGVWAFVTISVKNMTQGSSEVSVKGIALYILCIALANTLQGVVVLPLLLKFKGISPIQTLKGASQALMVAFFSKSSTTALPITLKNTITNLNVSPRVANFTIPLCTTINMNGCAAFILTTVLFVSISNGISFSLLDMILWIFIATFAAIGNAGVPMGCYFLASAFLASLDVPLYIMGVILPIHAILDMPETTLNVWSDVCITKVIDKELNTRK